MVASPETPTKTPARSITQDVSALDNLSTIFELFLKHMEPMMTTPASHVPLHHQHDNIKDDTKCLKRVSSTRLMNLFLLLCLPLIASFAYHGPLIAQENRLMETQSIDGLRDKLIAFYQKREWDPFHSPKNLAMDLASEVGELVDPFRWLTEEQSHALDEKTLQEVKDEIGDVFKCIVYLAHKLGIDPVEAAYQKLEKMEQKYPADACRGKALKYTAYEQ